MRVDLSGIQDGAFDVIPSGRYQAKLSDGEIRESKSSAKHPGAEYISWEFTVLDGEFEGRKLWQITSLSHGTCDCSDWKDSSLFGLKAILSASQIWTTEELASEEFDFEINDIIGTDFTLIVAIRQYQGEDQNDVKRVKPFAPLVSDGSQSATLLP